MIVEDPNDITGADADAVLVLDDWLDGLGTTPDSVLMALNPAISGAGTADTAVGQRLRRNTRKPTCPSRNSW